jgi:hypothetical protein
MEPAMSMNPSDDRPASEPPSPAPESDQDATIKKRRELLKRIGKYGLYTAPALLAIFASQQRAYGY